MIPRGPAKAGDRRRRNGAARPRPRLFGAVPIPGYERMCGWCGKVQPFVHCRGMTVCGVCGN